MKKSILQYFCVIHLFVITCSCGASGEKKDLEKSLQEKAQNKLKEQTPGSNNDKPSTDGPKEVMSVAAASKFIAAADANKGKQVTVAAYPKGTTKATNGEFMLYVSDKNETGLTNENFACVFKEEMKDQVRTHKAGVLVKVTGNIAWNNGMIVLKNSVLTE
jgi:hypothetical protein